MGFVADSVVKASVAGALHQEVADLEPIWDTVVNGANAAAYDQILAHFYEFGFTKSQVDAWGPGATYQKYLARYQALMDGAGDREQAGEWRKELDYWRGNLDKLKALTDAAGNSQEQGTLFEFHSRGW